MSKLRGFSRALRILSRQCPSSSSPALETSCGHISSADGGARSLEETYKSQPTSLGGFQWTSRQGISCKANGTASTIAWVSAAHGKLTFTLAGQQTWLPNRTLERSVSNTSIQRCSPQQKSESRSQQEDAAGVSSRGSRDAVWNWPNAISVGRMMAGPLVAYLILEAHWPAAFVTLVVAGASDWLDGYVAKSTGQGSVLGSYLDPLADKILMGCTAGALAYEGSLPAPLAVLIIGRDVFLVVGAFAQRFRDFNWRWPGWTEFLRTAPPMGGLSAASPSSQGSNADNAAKAEEDSQSKAAHFVEPLFVSKVNTVAQLGLVAGCISHSWYGWPADGVLWGLGGSTAVLTVASGWAYLRAYRAGNLHATRIGGAR